MQCPAFLKTFKKEFSANSKSGFTLIELMISVGILTLLSAAMIPSFNSYLNNQNVTQGVEQIKSDIRNVQNKALTGAGFDKVANTTHWGIKFSNDTQQYEWKVFSFASAITSANCSSSWASPKETSQNLNSDVRIYGVSSTSKCIFFNFTNGDATFVNGSNVITNCSNSTICSINVKRSSDTSAQCKNLTITAPGLVRTNSATVLCAS